MNALNSKKAKNLNRSVESKVQWFSLWYKQSIICIDNFTQFSTWIVMILLQDKILIHMKSWSLPYSSLWINSFRLLLSWFLNINNTFARLDIHLYEKMTLSYFKCSNSSTLFYKLNWNHDETLLIFLVQLKVLRCLQMYFIPPLSGTEFLQS